MDAWDLVLNDDRVMKPLMDEVAERANADPHWDLPAEKTTITVTVSIKCPACGHQHVETLEVQK